MAVKSPGAYTPSSPSTGGSSAVPGTSANLFSDLYGITNAELGQPITIYGSNTTVGQALNAFLGLPFDQQQQWANQLVSAGILPETSVGDPTKLAAAYVQLLHMTATNPHPDLQYVLSEAQLYHGTYGAGGSAASRAPGRVTVDLTNPQDIQVTADTVAQRLIGRKLRPDELAAVVGEIHAQESSVGATKAGAAQADWEAKYGGIGGGPASAGGTAPSGQPSSDFGAPQALTGAGSATMNTSGAGAMSPGQHGNTSVVQAITQVATRLGVPVGLAMAIAQQESGLNPQAVGDNGTSFGLYQLHRGGELGNMSQDQAFDPVQNATVALTEVAGVYKAHPDWSWGQIAAAAQRPADPVAYALDINTIAGQPTADVSVPSGTAGSPTAGGAAPTDPGVIVTDVNQPPTATGETAAWLEQNRAPEYQTQNLLNVFQQIQAKLASPDPSLNPHVLNNPVKM